jgi:transposase-like protein
VFISRKGKLNPEAKLELVERYLEGALNQSQVTNEATVDRHAFRDWIRLYDAEGPSGLLTKTKNTVYIKRNNYLQ